MRRGVVARGGFARKDGEAVDHQIVDIAVHPILAGLVRLDDRVLRAVEVLRRVLVGRRVAAADVSAGHAKPQVDPFLSGVQAFLAAVTARLDGFAALLVEFLEVSAGIFHEGPP